MLQQDCAIPAFYKNSCRVRRYYICHSTRREESPAMHEVLVLLLAMEMGYVCPSQPCN